MTEQLDTSHLVSSSYIPEREFWAPHIVDQYLDSDGRPLKTIEGNEDYERRTVPLIDPVNYPLVDMMAFVDDLKSLFKPGYTFPKHYIKRAGSDQQVVIRIDDNVDHLQPQHQYQPERFNGDNRPYRFCDDPERKMRLPTLPHNVRNIFYDDPPFVEEDFREAHMVSMGLNTHTLYCATQAVRAHIGVNVRRRSVRKKYQVPSDPDDTYGKKFVYDRRRESYKKYEEARDRLKDLPPDTPYTYLAEALADAKPMEAIQVLSRITLLGPYWDMRRYVRNDDKSVLSNNPRQNATIHSMLTVTKKAV